MLLLAVHISDNVLSGSAVALGFLAAGLMLIPAVIRLRDEDVSRIALLTAAFFVSSSIRVAVGGTSVHLLLNALVGIVLGRKAPLAVAVGIFLQAVLLAHGGYTTVGVNTAVIAGPALLARPLFRLLASGRPSSRRAAWAGGVTTFLVVVLTAAVNAAVLVVGGEYNWSIIAGPEFVVYLLLGVIEGLIVSTTAGFLARARPELLGLDASPTADATSSQSRRGS